MLTCNVLVGTVTVMEHARNVSSNIQNDLFIVQNENCRNVQVGMFIEYSKLNAK